MTRMLCPRCTSRNAVKSKSVTADPRPVYTCSDCGFVWINGTTGGKFRGPQPAVADERVVAAHVGRIPTQLLDPPPAVYVTLDSGRTVKLFTFWPDQVTFTPDDFVGLTIDGAMQLRTRRCLTVED